MILKHKFQIVLTLLLIASTTLNSFAQNKWELKKNSEGIAVYTSDVEGSAFKAFRTKTKISAVSMEEIKAVILDYENYNQLFPNAQKSKLIKKYDDGHFIIYMQTASPWPADDRDGVYEVKKTLSHNEEKLVVSIACIPGYEPVHKGLVRMTKGSGFWEVKKSDKTFYEITYQYHVDPAGKVPAWLANAAIVSIPFKTMQNFKKILNVGN